MLQLASVLDEGLVNKSMLAVLSALLGFAAALIGDQLRRRREPKKQLSWDATVEQGMISASEEIKRLISVRYRDVEVRHLVAIRVHITNTGNRVVKNHFIRIAFPKGTKILDTGAYPPPEPELDISASSEGLSQHEVRYRIGHLERGQEFGLLLVASGLGAEDWKIFSHNDEGDVEFVGRDSARARADLDHVRPFVIYFMLFLFVPPIIAGIPTEIDFGALFRLAFLLPLLPHMPAIARIVTSLIANRNRGAVVVNADSEATVYFAHGETSVRGDLVMGRVFKKDPVSNEQIVKGS